MREEQAAGSRRLPVPVYYGSAKKGPWHSTVDGCGDRAVPTDWGTGERRPMRQRFQGGVYRLRPAACLSTAIQRNAAPAGYGGPGRERKAENHRDAYSIQRGNCSDRHRLSGEIVILPSDSVRLNDVLGDPTRLPRKRWREGPPPHAADVDCAENGSAKRTAAGRSYATCGYLTRFCAARWIPSPMRSFFLFWAGAVGGCFRFAVGKIQA